MTPTRQHLFHRFCVRLPDGSEHDVKLLDLTGSICQLQEVGVVHSQIYRRDKIVFLGPLPRQ